MGNHTRTGRYATLKGITHPALIVQGNKDIVVPPINALILAEHLPNAQLIVYSDSSHGPSINMQGHSCNMRTCS